MKKASLLGMITWMMLIGFTACSEKENDELEDQQKQEAIVGKWTMISIKIGDSPPNEPHHQCPTKRDYLEFKTNNKVNEVWYDSDCKETLDVDMATYTVTDNKIKVSGKLTLDGTFQISGKTLTIEYEQEVGPGSPLFKHTLVFERL